MALFDLIGRRWTLRIIWELHEADRPLRFRELRAACGEVSSSVLTRRLHELADAQVVAHTGAGYALTASGRALVVSLRPVLRWADDWARGLEVADRAAERRAG
jgi:DNA-binding HxlR family transcriptional regulator